MKNNEIMTLIIIGSNISGTSGRLHTFPSSFKHYAAHGFWTGQLHWEMLRPRVQVASASNPNRYPLVVKPGDRKSCFYSWLSYWNIGFSWPGYAIGGCTFQKFKVRNSEYWHYFQTCGSCGSWNSSVGFSLVISSDPAQHGKGAFCHQLCQRTLHRLSLESESLARRKEHVYTIYVYIYISYEYVAKHIY